MKLHEIYTPITAKPFKNDKENVEIKPCEELAPYIRCFWGSKNPYREDEIDKPFNSIIIPDTCMDIIFNINYTDNKIDSSFCGIDERSFLIQGGRQKRMISTFGIRFYPWSAFLFTDDSLKNTKNAAFDLEYHFSKIKREIEPLLFDVSNIMDRIKIVEKYLIENIHLNRKNTLLMDSVNEILVHHGNIEIDQLSKDVHISSRQLQRIFSENIGLTPKKLSSLIRYQYLWQDALYRTDFDVMDAVSKYGFVDQSHLLNEFKKYHTLTITKAKKAALQDVAFLQDSY